MYPSLKEMWLGDQDAETTPDVLHFTDADERDIAFGSKRGTLRAEDDPHGIQR